MNLFNNIASKAMSVSKFMLTAICTLSFSLVMGQIAYVANLNDNNIAVVDLQTAAITGTIDLSSSPVRLVASPDGSQIASVNGNSVAFINTADNSLITEISNGVELFEVLYSLDGSTVYTIDQATTLITPYSSVDQSAGQFGFLLSGTGPVAGAFNPTSGNLSVVNNGSNNVATFTTGPLMQMGDNIAVGQAPQDIVFLSDGTGYVSNFNGNSISILGGGSLFENIPAPTQMAVSPDESLLYVLSENNLVSINLPNGTINSVLQIGNAPRGLAVSSDGEFVVVTDFEEGSLRIIEVETNTQNVISVGSGAFGVALIDAPAVNTDPIAAFTATPQSGDAPLTVSFDASASSDAEGDIASYDWDFGNGTTGIGVTATATYTMAGTFTVTLTVTDADGATATTTSSVVVEEPVSELEAALQAAIDAQGLTDILGLNFGGVSASVLTDEGIINLVTGNATPAIPVSEDQAFGLSDVSQLIYGVLTLISEDAGLLSFDQPIGDVIDVTALTNVPGNITIRQLLKHTSGLDEFSDKADYTSTILADPGRAFTATELTELFVGAPADPGTFSYANTNFLVLGLVLDALNGPLTLQESVDLLLEQVGISGIQVYSGNDPMNLAPLFADLFGTGFPNQITPNTSVFTGAGAAGNLLATPETVLQIIAGIQELVDEGILSENVGDLLEEFDPIQGRLSAEYGLGIERFNLDFDGVTLPIIGHTGSVNYVSALLYSQDADKGVFLVTNNGLASEADVLELARQLLDICIDGNDFPQEENFTLQFLHASDLEGGVEALNNAPNFAAIIEGLEADNDNTIILSSGDNYIPGPFFNAAGDFSLRSIIQEVNQEFFNEPGLTNFRETAGRIDINIMNIIGFDASAIGNHEFDAGPTAYRDIITTDIRGTQLDDVRWLGAQFPYLSANYDFSAEGALSGAATTDIFLRNTAFQSFPSDLDAAAAAPKIAPATVIERGGELVGVIGATTQILSTISSTGSVAGLTPNTDDMAALAGILQPIIDEFEAEGINKIVLVTHLQQEALEQELAGLLTGIDIIFAGGSDVLRAQADDVLRPGDVAVGNYPFTTTDAEGNTVAIVGIPGEYSYVGRLAVEFDENGQVIETSLNDMDNGVYASLDEVVTTVAGNDPFAVGTDAELVQRLTNAIGDLVNEQDGNILGRTSVFIEGRREAVRTEETNMGNLTADANLALAQSFDATVEVSLKNGGGIRAAIGQIVDNGDGTSSLVPPQANPSVGKEEGDISQLDVVNTLRFNNGLSLLTLTVPEFKQVLEHAFASTSPGSTPGRFPQVGGFSVSVDTAMAEGSQIVDVNLVDENGQVTEQLIDNGNIVASADRTVRIVTLDFLAGGGDSYPYPDFANTDRVDLEGLLTDAGQATFADPGTEQDAIAEYLLANFLDTPFAEAETPASEDTRIIFGEFEEENFTLQFLHASDLEGGVEALSNAPNFAAIIEGLEAGNDNTIILSSGDNYIPGPFFNAAGDFSLRSVIQEVNQEFYNEPGLTNLREAPGRIDINIMNIIGFDASAIGNHEFDAGPDAYSDIIGTDIRGGGLGDVRWLGAQFPYLSANYDFSTEGALSGLATTDIFQPNTAFQSLPSNLGAAGDAPKIAPSTIIERGGELIGVIGATTQVLSTISSTGSVAGLTPNTDDMAALAEILQPIIDEFEREEINKIVLVTHLQQETLEQELAGLLTGIDIIFAGGSDVLRAQADDILRPGDVAVGDYPFTTTDAEGNTVAIVGIPGEYSYVGRLAVEFDENGQVIEASLNDMDNGVYASLDEVVTTVAGNDPFAVGTGAELVQRLTNAIGDLVNEQDGNILGRTSVFIEGRREAVRTEETNMGNLTADANLVLAQSIDATVEVSLKNGGGIRAAIGQIIDNGDGTSSLVPPQANPSVGKEEGDISQLDVVNTLRFNNGLSLLTLTVPEFKQVLEHAFASTSPGSTPGRFPQVGGFSVSVDTAMAEGDQVIDVFLTDADGQPTEQLIDNGEIIASDDRTIRIVTLDFLAGGGDAYPYEDFANTDRVDLEGLLTDAGQATFADPGTEQDAIAEYLLANFLNTPFAEAETPASEDTRIIFGEFDDVNEAPTATLTAEPTSGIAPLTVSFDASGSMDADGEIVSFDYDFGDGNTGSGAMTSNTFTTPGTYTVTVTVTDNDDATATASVTIVVEEEETLQGELEDILDEQEITNVSGLNFGGVSAAVLNDEGLFTVTTGQSTPVVPMDETLRLGASDVSQTVLAVLTFALMEEGALMLSQTVGDFIDATALTNVPASITLRQLLTHTSGLDDFSDDDTYVSTILNDPARSFTAAELTELFVGEPSATGTFAYANTNFLVLGLVLEAANGEETLDASLDRLVLSPAGISTTAFYDGGSTTDPADLAPLFADLFGTGFPNQITPNTSIFTGASFAGNILSTPTEMLQFIDAVATGGVLTSERLMQMLSFTAIQGRISNEYGLGIERFFLDLDGVQDIPFIGHTGDINYVTTLLYSVEAGAGVYVATNNGVASEEDVFNIAVELLDAAIDGNDIDIVNDLPMAIFTADPTSGVEPLEVSFDASASVDPDGMIVDYAWDFGDNTTGNGVTTTHSYTAAGTYVVTLSVTDNDGAIATATQTITVTEAPMDGTARVQIIHNADSETVSVSVNGEEFLPALAYRTATPYVDVPAGTPLEISIMPVNEMSEATAITATVTLTADVSYVIMAYGTFDDSDDFPVEVAVFEGATETVGSEEVGIQFFHGSNDAGAVDITLEDNSVLFDNVSYGSFGMDYLVVPADRYTLNVTPAMDNSNIVATYSAGFNFWRGRSAVIFATELLGDGTFQPWVALSNGGTYPLSAVSNFIQPEVSNSFTAWNNAFEIAPNPVMDFAQISLNLPEARMVNQVTLHGAGGRLIRTYQYGQLGKGLHSFELNVAELGTGTYYLQLRSDAFVQTLPLIVTK